MKFYLFLFLFIFFTNLIFSQDSIRILFPGQYHDDEIDSSALKLKWFGLYESEGNYFLSKTKIDIRKMYDPVLDEDSMHPSGDLLTIQNTGSCILLISGLKGMKERKIESLNSPGYVLMPGEIKEFDFNNLHYKFSAVGDAVEPVSGWLNGDYKLFIEETGNFKIRQLISQDSMHSELPYTIMWSGDLDNDGELDLLVNLSNHYNLSMPVLFLSSKKENNTLLKKAASFYSVGC